ncbi:MAG: hypothetical protein WB699_13240 [Bacteroidota bacterium]
MRKLSQLVAFSAITVLCIPAPGHACACGCNVFSVGAAWMMPVSSGFGLFLHYNYMDQGKNWSNWNGASAESNDDKEIRTSFYTLSLQYMASREWGFMIEAPIWDRYFRTIGDDGNPGAVNQTAFGDVRIMGMYTGLSEDMSIGLQYGLKLPTGSFHQSLMDRDTQIGTGTTDLLVGGYWMRQENGWGWYGQVLWQRALNSREGYRAGDSFDANVGVHYDNLLDDFPIVPSLQLVGSFRAIDSGPNAVPQNTGYERVYLAPGIEVVASRHLTVYGDIRIPVLTHVRGYQLVAPALYSASLGYTI